MDDPRLGRILGSGKEADVFEDGPVVVKLYKSTAPKRSAFREAAVLALVEPLGLPVPHVLGVKQFGDRWGVIMTRADGPSFADVMLSQPDVIPTYLNEMARLQARVHRYASQHLPSLKAKLATDIKEAPSLGEERQTTLLSGLATMPDGDRLCHGDFHPFNILGRPGREIVIDWLNATLGDPAADVCRSYVLIRHVAPDVAAAYIDAYTAIISGSRERILGWLPFVAAARLAEDVSEEEAGLLEMVGLR